MFGDPLDDCVCARIEGASAGEGGDGLGLCDSEAVRLRVPLLSSFGGGEWVWDGARDGRCGRATSREGRGGGGGRKGERSGGDEGRKGGAGSHGLEVRLLCGPVCYASHEGMLACQKSEVGEGGERG